MSEKLVTVNSYRGAVGIDPEDVSTVVPGRWGNVFVNLKRGGYVLVNGPVQDVIDKLNMRRGA